jgi:hypothetical protein
MSYGLPESVKEQIRAYFMDVYALAAAKPPGEYSLDVRLTDDDEGPRIEIKIYAQAEGIRANRCHRKDMRWLDQAIEDVREIEFWGERREGEYASMGPDTPPTTTGTFIVWVNQ